MIVKSRCLQHPRDAMAEPSALDALSLWPWTRRVSGCSSTLRCNRGTPSKRSCFMQADQPDYWNQVYKVQSLHGRFLYEWYGLGQQLSFCFVGCRGKHTSLMCFDVESPPAGYQQLHGSLMNLLEPLPAHSASTARRACVCPNLRRYVEGSSSKKGLRSFGSVRFEESVVARLPVA